MYTVKVIKKTKNRTLEEVFRCRHYKREIISETKESFSHKLYLDGVDCFEDGVIIDLYNMMEDKFGKYEQDVFIMNDAGQTIDRY